MRAASVLLLSLFTSTACDSAGGPAGGSGAPLVAPSELAALEEALLAEIEQNRARSCEAPVLSGAPTPGPADPFIVALMRATAPEVKACIDAIGTEEESVRAALRGEPAQREIVAAVEEKCAPVDPLVLAAASHADACSPFLAGRNAMPPFLNALRLGRAVALRAVQHGRDGDVQRGLDLALAGLRLTQDLSRGEGAPLVAAMVGAAAMQAILEGAVQPLLEHPSVTSEQVEATRGALGRLLEAEQSYGTFLPYESAGFVLETVLPELKAPGWEPPGGWPADRPGPRDPHEETKTVSGDPKQDMALTWVAINETSAALESACPVDASMAACVGGLEAHAKAAAERAQRSQLSRYMELLAAKDPNPVLRGWIVDILAGIAVPSHDKYVKKHYTRRAMLAAARLHAAVRLERLAGRGCPQPDDLKKESWTPQLAVPGVEGTLRVEQEQGGLAVRPPETLEQQGGEPFAYRIPCG